METEMPPPESGGPSGPPSVDSDDRPDALLRAREAAAKAVTLRELGDEFAALTAEVNSRTWLRKFAALHEQSPDRTANEDLPEN